MKSYLTAATVCILVAYVKSTAFDIFVFAQQWPQSVCIGSNLTHDSHKCMVDKQVNTWTIHGLWPTKLEENPPGPSYCNNSSKFNETTVKPLMPKLLEYWPNLYKEEPNDSLWKHEWEKHGTCAVVLEELDSEFKYFNRALSLNRLPQFDLLSRLKNSGINPSDGLTYPYTSVLKVLGDVKVQCYYDRSKKTQYLTQVEMCISKDLEKQIPCNVTHEERGKRSLDMLSSPKRTEDVVKLYKIPNINHNRRHKSIGMEDCYDTEDIAFPIMQH